MYSYPHTKNITYIVPFDVGLAVYKYRQATAQESFDYFDMMESKHILNITEYRDKFQQNLDAIVVTKKRPRYIPTKWRNAYYTGKIKRYLRYSFMDYCSEIVNTLHKIRDSPYKGIPHPKQDGERKQLFESSIEILSQKTGIPYDEVHKKLTLEQEGRILDKARFDYYETFDAGKGINLDLITKQPSTKEQEDLLNKFDEDEIGANM